MLAAGTSIEVLLVAIVAAGVARGLSSSPSRLSSVAVGAPARPAATLRKAALAWR